MKKIYVRIFNKPSVLDPQGKVIGKTLSRKYKNIVDVRVGKLIELTIDTDVQQEADTLAHEVSSQILANLVMEDYEIESNVLRDKVLKPL